MIVNVNTQDKHTRTDNRLTGADGGTKDSLLSDNVTLVILQ